MIHGRRLHDYRRKNNKIKYNECLLIRNVHRWIIDFWSCFIKRFKSLLTDTDDNPSVSTTNSKLKSNEKLVELNLAKDTCNPRRRKRKKSKNYEAKIVNKYQETILTISHRSDTDFSKLCKNQSLFSMKNLNCGDKPNDDTIKSIDKVVSTSVCKIKSSHKNLPIKSESVYNLEKRKYSDVDTVEVKWIPGPFFDRSSQSESNIKDVDELKKINEIKKLNDRMKRRERRISKIPRLKKNNEIVCKKHSN